MTKYYRSAKHLICLSLKQFVFIAFFFTGLWLFYSCEEPPTMIGGEILPRSEHFSIFSTDTFKITSYTNYDSKIRTETIKNPFIGVYHDDDFGTTTSGFVSQLRLEAPWWEGEESWIIDSVKLVLRVTSNLGKNDNLRHYLRISEISTMLQNDAEYHSDKSVDTTGFGVYAYIPPLRSDTINNIEIKLPDSFGERVIKDQSKLFYTTDPKEEDFRNYFKGIYITMPSASAANPFLLGFDFTYGADENKYYSNYIIIHIKDSTKYRDAYRFLLDPRRENARFAKIEHNLNANIKDLIYKAEKEIIEKGDSLSYVQGLFGAYTTISIPGLEAIKNDPARARSAVNKAQLIVPVDLINYADTVAPQLLMRYVNDKNEKEMVPDYFITTEEGISYFGGFFDEEKKEYRFNIASFVQNYLKDTQNKLKPEVEIFLPANNAANAILKANDSKTPLKFELTLTNY